MRKILIIICLVFLTFSGYQVYAQECAGEINNVNYGFLNPRPNNEYGVGEMVETRLSFDITGDDTVITQNKPVEIVLTMDRSSSMILRLFIAKRSLTSVVERIREIGNPQNKLALVTFSSSATLDQSLTNDYDLVNDKIRSFHINRGTSIGGGLLTSAEAISSADNDSGKYIIISSDGNHNTSPSIASGISSVPSDVTVYTIGIGAEADEDVLQNIARNAGTGQGEYFYADDVSELTALFGNIVEIILEFEASNFNLTFFREDIDKTDFVSSNPTYSSINPSESEISWNFGTLKSGDSKAVDIDYKVDNYSESSSAILNKQALEFSYDLPGGAFCSSTMTVGPLSIQEECDPNITYSCVQTGPDCSEASCREVKEKSRTCVENNLCTGTRDVGIDVCESMDVSCPIETAECLDSCSGVLNWREIAP